MRRHELKYQSCPLCGKRIEYQTERERIVRMAQHLTKHKPGFITRGGVREPANEAGKLLLKLNEEYYKLTGKSLYLLK